ncbi:calcium/sodium antiporter [candidate division KSB1 bacterium]
MLSYLLLVIGFALLIKSADYLVTGASSFARIFNVSELVIGLTMVAFGTSMPELFISIMAAVSGNPGLAIGNILGSNIANILLVLGTASIIYPISVSRGTVWKEIPLSLLAAILVGIIANDKIIENRGYAELSRIDGLVLLCFFIIFIYYLVGIARKNEGWDEHVQDKRRGMVKSLLLFVIGLMGLGIGSKLIVDSAVKIAAAHGVSQSFIGLSVVAIGTSLPELATSVVAALKKNTEIAVGNAVGSNIFNIFLVLGVTSLITPLPFQMSNNIDIGMTIFASLVLFLTMFIGGRRRIIRWERIVMVILYFSFIAFSFLIAV